MACDLAVPPKVADMKAQIFKTHYHRFVTNLFFAMMVVWALGLRAAEPVVKLSSVGSDTMGVLMTSLGSMFSQDFPAIAVQVQANGSSTAPPALQEGAASLGPMSRRMSHSEKARFRERYGYDITEIVIGVDAIAVFVHWQNPLQQMSLPEVDAIFSQTMRCGAPKPILHWSQLLPNETNQVQTISTFGRNSASGTYSYFREVGLCGGDFRITVAEQPGSSSVVQSVGASRGGIGYSGVGYQSPLVKMLSISLYSDSLAYSPSAEASLSGQYPLARPLYLYVNQSAASPLHGPERDFVDLVLSTRGQSVISDSGFIPLPHAIRGSIRQRLGLK